MQACCADSHRGRPAKIATARPGCHVSAASNAGPAASFKLAGGAGMNTRLSYGHTTARTRAHTAHTELLQKLLKVVIEQDTIFSLLSLRLLTQDTVRHQGEAKPSCNSDSPKAPTVRSHPSARAAKGCQKAGTLECARGPNRNGVGARRGGSRNRWSLQHWQRVR